MGALLGGSSSASPAAGDDIWDLRLAGGYEVFTNTYALAENDTTETIAEATFTATLSGRSGRRAPRRWRLSVESSVGTELLRESFTGEYRWRDGSGATRLRIGASGRANQYRKATDYGLNSDSREGRMKLRAFPVAHGDLTLETTGWLTGLSYEIPSTLELDQREAGAALVLRRARGDGARWSLGGHFARRTYPDSTGLDRATTGLEANWEGAGLRVYHRTDRRQVRDEETRSPAWYHWTDLNGNLPLAQGEVFFELQSEIWRYDHVQAAFPDYLRLSNRLGYAWGDELGVRWRAGFSGEIMRSEDDTESYDQYGALAGVESFGLELSGFLLVESGWRRYRGSAENTAPLDAISTGTGGSSTGFTDFQYWKIWLNVSWNLSSRLALDALASYEPERHGEKSDDTTLGFASIRLVWRPGGTRPD